MLVSFLLSTCHIFTSTLLILVERPANWRSYSIQQERTITGKRDGADKGECEWDRGMIVGQLNNWLLIQCSLHIRGSPSPLTDKLFTKCGNSGNQNRSIHQWKLILTTDSLVVSLPFTSLLCLSLLLAFSLVTSWQPNVSLYKMSVSNEQSLWHASAHYGSCHCNW